MLYIPEGRKIVSMEKEQDHPGYLEGSQTTQKYPWQSNIRWVERSSTTHKKWHGRYKLKRVFIEVFWTLYEKVFEYLLHSI